MATTRGVFIYQAGKTVVVRASLKDIDGVRVTAGTIRLRLFEVQDDGTLLSFDFSDNTFKTSALTTASAAMTHRQGNNNTYNTGLWTYALATVTGFTAGATYVAQISDESGTPTASPLDQEHEFQYGATDGDPTYMADVFLDRASGTDDAWTAVWFRDGVRIASGLTSPTLQVIKRSDGTDLVAATAMTQVGSTGAYKKDEAINKVTTGESYLAVVGMTHDGAARAFARVIGRDA
jgi:hypothetical protein